MSDSQALKKIPNDELEPVFVIQFSCFSLTHRREIGEGRMICLFTQWASQREKVAKSG